MSKSLIVTVLSVGMAMCGYGVAYPTDLLYYSKLDSETDITNPSVGVAGTVTSPTFQAGKNGNALYVPAYTSVAEIPFPDGLADKGCIEFDAQIKNTNSTYGDGGDPSVFVFKAPALSGYNAMLELSYNANNGAGGSGLLFGGTGDQSIALTGSQCRYSDILGTADPKGWHHYKLLWNCKGLSGSSHTLAIYIDGTLRVSGYSDATAVSKLETNLKRALVLTFGAIRSNSGFGKSPFLIDEFKIWKTDTPKEDVELPVVSEVTAKQHYPWCGKIDIGYAIAGATDGLSVKITVRDNDNDVTYEAKTFDVNPSAAEGAHTVVWDATKDGVDKVSKNMVATVSLVVP